MELDTCIINIDAINCFCTIGNIERTTKGLIKAKNKSNYSIENTAIPFAIRALGKRAKILISDYNKITNVDPYENNSFKSSKKFLEFSGFYLEKINGIENSVTMISENSRDFSLQAQCSARIQQIGLPFLGKQINCVLSTKDPILSDRNKRITDITAYQAFGGAIQ